MSTEAASHSYKSEPLTPSPSLRLIPVTHTGFFTTSSKLILLVTELTMLKVEQHLCTWSTGKTTYFVGLQWIGDIIDYVHNKKSLMQKCKYWHVIVAITHSITCFLHPVNLSKFKKLDKEARTLWPKERCEAQLIPWQHYGDEWTTFNNDSAEPLHHHVPQKSSQTRTIPRGYF